MYLGVQNIRSSSTNKYIRMYLSVLNIHSSSTDPGTITITNSANLTHSPDQYCTTRALAYPQNPLAERGVVQVLGGA
jgi:hypothetical protein